jgi:hypothetical protein
LDCGLHGGGVKPAVRLCPWPAYRRTLAAVEHPKLNARGVGNPTHQAIQCIDLTNEMTLAKTTDRRITGHRADGRKAMGYQRRLCAHPRGPARGLASRVAASNDNDVE